MKRLLLLLAATLSTALAVAQSAVPPVHAQPSRLTGDQQAQHVLNRLAFGARPRDVARVKAMGVERYIAEQLQPERLDEPPELQQRLSSLDTLRMSAGALFRAYGPPALRQTQNDPEARKALQEGAKRVAAQAAEARLARALASPRQLEEVMVDFWFNHFNVFAGKGLVRVWAGLYEREAIRPHVLGRFRDLLGATARHPAMLFYLDNYRSSAPGVRLGAGPFKSEGLNENYARELMELHTVGVDGGYTQQDVVALARIFTGWGFDARSLARGDGGAFAFDERRHDFADKTFLGHRVPGSGMAEGEWALDVLAAHPATARRVSYKLAQYFVADAPPPVLVDRLAQRFLASRGDIRATLQVLFASPEFWDPQYIGMKLKTPYQYVLSSLRAADQPVVDVRPVLGTLIGLGMPLYGCPTPDGYKNTESAWLNPEALTRRINFATALGAGQLPLDREPEAGANAGLGKRQLERGANVALRDALRADATGEGDTPRRTDGVASDASAPSGILPPRPPGAERGRQGVPLNAQVLTRTLDGTLTRATLDTVAAAPRPLQAGMILGSPEFMRR